MSSRDTYRFLLRMPPELREPLREAAERNGRSLNAEIVARLAAGERTRPATRTFRRPRALPAIALAGALAVAATGAFLQQRVDGAPEGEAANGSALPQGFANQPAYALAKQLLATEPQSAPAR